MSINPNSNRNYYRTLVRIGNEAGSGESSPSWEIPVSFNGISGSSTYYLPHSVFTLPTQSIEYNNVTRTNGVISSICFRLTEQDMGAIQLPWYDEDDQVTYHTWEPRLMKISSLRESFPKGFQPGFPLPTLTLEIANPDERYTQALKSFDYFAGWPVSVYTISPDEPINEEEHLRFKGYIEHSGGATIKRDRVILKVSDFRNKWSGNIPRQALTTEGMEDLLGLREGYDLPEENEGKPIPLLYGDYKTTSDDSRYGVEAFCIDKGDKDTNKDPVLLVAKPADNTSLKSLGNTDDFIAVVRKSPEEDEHEVSKAKITVVNTSKGTVEFDRSKNQLDPSWDDDYEYKEGDRFFLLARGQAAVEDGVEYTIKNPAEVIYDLLVHHAGASEDDIDITSYNDVRAVLNDGFYWENWRARRHLTKSKDLWKLIRSICQEFGIEISNRKGKVYFSLWLPYLNAALEDREADLTDSDYVDGTFQVQIDPDDSYMNSLSVDYKYDERKKEFIRHFADWRDPQIAQADSGQEMEWDWAYKRPFVEMRTGHIVGVFSRAVEVIKFKTGFKGLSWSLGDHKAITYSPLGIENMHIKVRSLKKDFDKGVVEVEAWNAFILINGGRWAPTPTTPNTISGGYSMLPWLPVGGSVATSYGHWTDALGRTIHGNNNSKTSHWL